MKRKDTFSVADFAKFTRTTRDTLLYYDRIGVLSPESRGENNYRYYSHGQVAIVNLIHTYQALGMTLSDIVRLKEDRTPEIISEVMGEQILHIDGKIEEWARARKLLILLRNTIQSVQSINENEITVQFLPAEAIILGDLNDYSRGKDPYEALRSFYRSCDEKYPDLDLNYPVWGFFSEERLKQGDWVWPDRYYFYNPDGLDRRPAALYAIGYARGGYGFGEELYGRMKEYIDANGFEISGPAYEEYPLNEISVVSEEDYLIRVMITVREARPKNDE